MSTHQPQPGIRELYPDAVSVRTRYRDAQGHDVAEVHYYRLRDGLIIPGMRPDPKLLFEDGVMYHKEKAVDRIRRLAEENSDIREP